MKKSISLLSVILIFCLISSSAEVTKIDGSFTVRNGISFGMTEQEINTIEVEVNGLQEGTINNDSLNGYTTLEFRAESIAGIEIVHAMGRTIEYYFNTTDGKMESIEYFFGYKVENHYEDLKKSIMNKYGNPLHDNDGGIFGIITPSLRTALLSIQYGMLYSGISDYSEWLVQFDDYYMIIDLYTATAKSGSGTTLNLAYRFISIDEIQKYIEDAETNQKQRDSDL